MRTYNAILIFLVSLLAASIIVFVALALTLQPPTVKNIYVSKTYAPTTAHNTTSSLTTTAAPTTTTNVSTTTAAPTTTPIPPVFITCPPDVTVVLGAPLDPPLTGGYANASGGCTLPSPIITYGDALNATFEARQSIRAQVPSNFLSRKGRLVQGISAHAHVFPTAVRKKRSPSYAQNTLFEDATPFSYAQAGGYQQPPDATSSASPQYIVQAVNTPQGSLVSIFDKNVTQLGFFYMSSLAQNSSCQGPGTVGQPQVLWDQNASAWLLAEIGNDNGTWCLYMSYADNPFGAYKAFAYNFAPFFPNYPKLGIWTRVYELTLALQNLTSNPASMCVIDRLGAIAWNSSFADPPTIFCGSPLFGMLPKFAFQAWTPASADGGAPLPPPYTESSGGGTVGAVFMRPIDDEFLFGANTPTTDLIEVEHWYNVNFTQATYDALRYLVAVQEFDSSFGVNCTEFACIPTPTAQLLNPVREVLMQKLAYQYLPQYDNQQSIVLTLTSNANGTGPSVIKWFEFRWVKPSIILGFQWFLHQQGTISGTTLSLFMPSASMDAQGTILVAYAGSSDVTYPQLGAAMRLRNDPTNGIRNGIVLVPGQLGSTILNNEWGSYFSVSTDPSGPRNFFVSGQVASNTDPWLSYLLKLRVAGEVYNRTWTAYDYCGNVATCVQFITAQ